MLVTSFGDQLFNFPFEEVNEIGRSLVLVDLKEARDFRCHAEHYRALAWRGGDLEVEYQQGVWQKERL